MSKSKGAARAGRGNLRLLATLTAFVLLTVASLAQGALPEVLAARVTTTPERARLIIDLSGPAEYAIATLDGPERIAVDVKASNIGITTPATVSGTGLVAAFTTTMTEDGRARTELTLTGPAAVQQAYLLDPIDSQPARLVVDLIPTTGDDFKAHATTDLANSIASQAPASIDAEGLRPALAPPSSAFAVVTPSSSSVDPTTVAALPSSAQADAPVALVAPAGSRPLIVIDPGHGGVDNGASAPNGVHEKDITLAFALQLRDLLVSTGMFDVAMTRDDDSYLTLNERVDLARENRADLFISLHADTFQEADIRGASIYTRDERATDILDKVLADGENRGDIVAGYVQPDTKPAVVDILVDLMRRQVRQQAYVAAQDMVTAMQPSVALRRFPLRQADFFVLQAPDVPSMLIELGFMSNNADIANLENIDWRNKVVTSIAQGVQDYFKDAGTTVASGG